MVSCSVAVDRFTASPEVKLYYGLTASRSSATYCGLAPTCLDSPRDDAYDLYDAPQTL